MKILSISLLFIMSITFRLSTNALPPHKLIVMNFDHLPPEINLQSLKNDYISGFDFRSKLLDNLECSDFHTFLKNGFIFSRFGNQSESKHYFSIYNSNLDCWSKALSLSKDIYRNSKAVLSNGTQAIICMNKKDQSHKFDCIYLNFADDNNPLFDKDHTLILPDCDELYKDPSFPSACFVRKKNKIYLLDSTKPINSCIQEFINPVIIMKYGLFLLESGTINKPFKTAFEISNFFHVNVSEKVMVASPAVGINKLYVFGLSDNSVKTITLKFPHSKLAMDLKKIHIISTNHNATHLLICLSDDQNPSDFPCSDKLLYRCIIQNDIGECEELSFLRKCNFSIEHCNSYLFNYYNNYPFVYSRYYFDTNAINQPIEKTIIPLDLNHKLENRNTKDTPLYAPKSLRAGSLIWDVRLPCLEPYWELTDINFYPELHFHQKKSIKISDFLKLYSKQLKDIELFNYSMHYLGDSSIIDFTGKHQGHYIKCFFIFPQVGLSLSPYLNTCQNNQFTFVSEDVQILSSSNQTYYVDQTNVSAFPNFKVQVENKDKTIEVQSLKVKNVLGFSKNGNLVAFKTNKGTLLKDRNSNQETLLPGSEHKTSHLLCISTEGTFIGGYKDLSFKQTHQPYYWIFNEKKSIWEEQSIDLIEFNDDFYKNLGLNGEPMQVTGGQCNGITSDLKIVGSFITNATRVDGLQRLPYIYDAVTKKIVLLIDPRNEQTRFSSEANLISHDSNLIAGYFIKEKQNYPCIWRKKDDDSWIFEELSIDDTHTKNCTSSSVTNECQIYVTCISDDSKILVGSCNGQACLWIYNVSTYRYEFKWLMDIIASLDIEISEGVELNQVIGISYDQQTLWINGRTPNEKHAYVLQLSKPLINSTFLK